METLSEEEFDTIRWMTKPFKSAYPFGDDLASKLGLNFSDGREYHYYTGTPKCGTVLFDDVNEEIVFNMADFGIIFTYPVAVKFYYNQVKNLRII